MDGIVELIFNMLDALILGMKLRYYEAKGELEKANDALNEIRPRAASIWRATRTIVLTALIAPFITLTVGIIFKQRWLIGIAGIAATVGHGIIFLIFAGLGDAIASIIKWAKPSTSQSGAKTKSFIFIHGAGTIILSELIVIGYVIIVPVWNNPGAISIVALLAIVLALMIVIWEWHFAIFRQIAFWIAAAAFVFFTISFFLPNTFSVLEERSPEVDQQLSFWARNVSFNFLADVPPLLGLGAFFAFVLVSIAIAVKYFSSTKPAPAVSSVGASAVVNTAPIMPIFGKWLKRFLIIGLAALVIYLVWPYAKALAGKTIGAEDNDVSEVSAQVNPDSSLVIPANSPRVNTGRFYNADDVIEWRASGQVSATYRKFDGEYIIVSPDGWTIHPLFSPPRLYLADGCPPMSLVGRIGDGQWFCMGTEGSRRAERNGILYVAFNDMIGFKGGRKVSPIIFFKDNWGSGNLRLN